MTLSLGIMLGISFSFTILCYFVDTACDNGELSKVGCLKRSSSVFPDMLANNRDETSSVFTGELIDWQDYEKSVRK